MVKHAAEFVTTGGYHWLYYQGCPYHHEFDHTIKVEDDKKQNKCGIGLVRWSINRLVGLEPIETETTGTVTTYPFQLQGECVSLNMDVESGGFAQVEVLDETGNVIHGYGLRDAVRIHMGDYTDLRPKWVNTNCVALLLDSVIRLRFSLNKSRLWSFQVVNRFVPVLYP